MAYAIQRAVKAERARLGLNQQQLAERMGWATSTVSDVETGKRSLLAHELPPLCEALETTLPELLGKAPEALRRMGI
jgi:transcriptional regulator with XRE-family HTH domain